ncbi:MAG: triosephosphate isomerase, partial [Candidatus Peregrinibacteria bacterium]|nr:triosephosphate isomerase [Candidatus Peregrinibacteria bacterium]
MRKLLIAGNWKMNPMPSPLDAYYPRSDIDVVVFPTFLDLKHCIDAGMLCGAQYAHAEDSGAHTGDIGMGMIKDLGCRYVLCGHSERRADHSETNEDVAAQAVAALEHGIHPIVCVGETEQERSEGREK